MLYWPRLIFRLGTLTLGCTKSYLEDKIIWKINYIINLDYKSTLSFEVALLFSKQFYTGILSGLKICEKCYPFTYEIIDTYSIHPAKKIPKLNTYFFWHKNFVLWVCFPKKDTIWFVNINHFNHGFIEIWYWYYATCTSKDFEPHVQLNNKGFLQLDFFWKITVHKRLSYRLNISL